MQKEQLAERRRLGRSIGSDGPQKTQAHGRNGNEQRKGDSKDQRTPKTRGKPTLELVKVWFGPIKLFLKSNFQVKL